MSDPPIKKSPPSNFNEIYSIECWEPTEFDKGFTEGFTLAAKDAIAFFQRHLDRLDTNDKKHRQILEDLEASIRCNLQRSPFYERKLKTQSR